MRLLFTCVAALLLAGPIRLVADEALKNGDFTDGTNHWSGDGRSAAMLDSDPAEKGMVVRVNSHDWTKVIQDCRPIGPVLTMTVTYRPSDDLKFSPDTQDYVNVPNQIGYGGWDPFPGIPGEWVLLLSDFGANTEGTFWRINPKYQVDKDGVATFTTTTRALNNKGDKTLTLAFPPGKGTITLLRVSMVASPLPEQ